MTAKIILASGSTYRLSLLKKLIPSPLAIAPDIDEQPEPNETPETLVERLAHQKAQAIANTHKDAWVIGSDQVAIINGEPLSKAGNFDNAFAQLKAASGQRIEFLTSLCLLNERKQVRHQSIERFSVYFRELSDQAIRRYLEIEQPYDCAGSFKCEGLGIYLFNKLEGTDPNTLIGLPLIKLNQLFLAEGIDLLDLH